MAVDFLLSLTRACGSSADSKISHYAEREFEIFGLYAEKKKYKAKMELQLEQWNGSLSHPASLAGRILD
jgi:hypothetical protein